MYSQKTDKPKPFNKTVIILIGVMLFILSRSWISDQITDQKDKRLFNLIAITLLCCFMFMVSYRKLKAGEYIKYKPLLYVGVVVYLAFLTYFFYLHFTTPA